MALFPIKKDAPGKAPRCLYSAVAGSPFVDENPTRMRSKAKGFASSTGIQCKRALMDNRASSPEPVLAHRRDAPQVSFTTRGNAAAAIASVQNDDDREAALEEYRRDKYSTTAPGSRSPSRNRRSGSGKRPRRRGRRHRNRQPDRHPGPPIGCRRRRPCRISMAMVMKTS